MPIPESMVKQIMPSHQVRRDDRVWFVHQGWLLCSQTWWDKFRRANKKDQKVILARTDVAIAQQVEETATDPAAKTYW